MKRIERVVQTCGACPSQWDIWTDDGEYLYGRYRWGHLSVSRGVGGESVLSRDIGDGLDGAMSTSDMLAHLSEAGYVYAPEAT